MGQFDKLNQLEKRAFSAEESASEVRWAIADEIVRLRDEEKATLEAIGAGWLNLKTQRPYGPTNVRRYLDLAHNHPAGRDRGDFFGAMQTFRDRDYVAERANQLPQNEEGVAMVLEKAAKVLQDKYDWTETEVKQEIAAAKVKAPKAEPEPKKTRVDHNYDLLVDALDLVRQIEPPLSKRAQTKVSELGLELDILREEATV